MHEMTQTVTVITKDGRPREFYGLPVAHTPDVAQIDEHNNVVITVPGTDGIAEQRVTFAAGYWTEVRADVEGPAPLSAMEVAA